MQIKATPYTYTDISGLNDLKRAARADQQSALKDVARQFEGLFLKMMLKSMRDASHGDPIFDSDQSKFYRDMFDNQLALSLSKGKGMGLAETLARQLGQQLPVQEKAQDAVSSLKEIRPTQAAYSPRVESAPIRERKIQQLVSAITRAKPKPEPEVIKQVTPPPQPQLGSVEKFVRTLWPMAERAAEELNTRPEVLLAQAALETGWGKYISKDEKGRSSYNLFNIKAGRSWMVLMLRKRRSSLKMPGRLPRMPVFVPMIPLRKVFRTMLIS